VTSIIEKYILIAEIEFKVNSPNANWNIIGINASPHLFIDGCRMMSKFISIKTVDEFLHEGEIAECKVEVFSAFETFSYEQGQYIYFMSPQQIASSNMHSMHRASSDNDYCVIESNSFLVGKILSFEKDVESKR